MYAFVLRFQTKQIKYLKIHVKPCITSTCSCLRAQHHHGPNKRLFFSVVYSECLSLHTKLHYAQHCHECKQMFDCFRDSIITLKVLVTTIQVLTLSSRISTAKCREGIADVGSARHESAPLPQCTVIRVLSYSNCQRSTHLISKCIFRNLAPLGVQCL